MINSFRGQYAWLSNFWFEPVIVYGLSYKSAEHAYQARKANTWQEWSAICDAETPGKAKRLARKVNLSGWTEDRRLQVMETVLRAKFSKGSDMAQRLLDTGDTELIEGNNWGDFFWGQVNGVGFNHLGQLLMKIRNELRKNAETVDKS